MSSEMSRSHRSVTLCVGIAAAVGAATAAASAVVSYWVAVGGTPAWMFERWGRMSFMTLRWRPLDVPIELFAALWFGIVAIGLVRSRPMKWVPATFVSSAVASGLLVWLCRSNGFLCTAHSIAAGCATIVMIASGSVAVAIVRPLVEQIGGTLRGLRSARSRTVSVLVLCAVFGAVALVQARIAATTPGEAADRIFRNWYGSRGATVGVEKRSGLSAPIRLIAYVDYQCPFSAQGQSKAEALFDELADDQPGRFSLETRDFPLNERCNPHFEGEFHKVACEAAVAMRVAKQELQPDAVAVVENWLYANGPSLTVESLEVYLKDLGVLEVYKSEFDAKMDDVRREAGEGGAFGVAATPGLFVNGIRLRFGATLLESALRYEVDSLTH